MEIYDLMSIAAEGYEKRQVNVFFQNDLFKTRVIVLEAVEKFLSANAFLCDDLMLSKVKCLIKKNEETFYSLRDQVSLQDPALLSMDQNLELDDGCSDKSKK